jgi:hypothetical protein
VLLGKYGSVLFLAVCNLLISVVKAEPSQDDNTQDTLFLREESILSDKGDISSELGIFFRRDSRTEVGINNQVSSVNEETSFLLATFRLGINRRSELSVSAPYQYVREESISLNGAQEDSNSGWGDVIISFKHQLWFEHGGYPDLVVGFSIDSDTGDIDVTGGPSAGSGFWEYSVSALAAKSMDPAVYFIHLGYQFADSEEIDGLLRRPGNTFQYRFGAGYALSANVMLSFQLTGDVIHETQVGQTRFPSEHQISFQFANTIILGRNAFIEPLISFGLTQEAPDVLFGLSMPILF